MKNEKDSKVKWDELVFSALEKIAGAPSKLKDPKESVTQAVEWVKGLREDLQEKVVQEISAKFPQLDWDVLSKKLAQQIVEHYDLEVTARISLKPKKKSKKEEPKHEEPVD